MIKMHKWVKTQTGFKIVLLGDDGRPEKELTFKTTVGEAIGRAMVVWYHVRRRVRAIVCVFFSLVGSVMSGASC